MTCRWNEIYFWGHIRHTIRQCVKMATTTGEHIGIFPLHREMAVQFHYNNGTNGNHCVTKHNTDVLTTLVWATIKYLRLPQLM
jgi:hypothetical protein